MAKAKVRTFAEVARRYLADRIVSKVYAGNVSRVAMSAGKMTVDAVNAHLRRRTEAVSSVTVRTERTILLSLYRYAYEHHLIDEPPRGVMKVKARKPPTKAWTVSQLQQAIESTKQHDATAMRSFARKGVWLRCWIVLGYETGARFGDLWSFSRDHLDGDTIAWTQSKTGDSLTRVLTPACLDLVDAMLKTSPDGTILGWACGKREAMRLMRAHLDAVGIGGTSKFLRRSGATHCEMAQPGAGRLHLGHRSPALFESAYADFSQLRTKTPKTPALI